MSAANTEALVEQFRQYLENLDPEALDRVDADDDPEPDLFTLLAELAALKNELRLESRQVKTAFEEFSGLFDTLREQNRRLQEELDRQRERARQDLQAAQQQMLLQLLELRDRLQAGQEQAAHYAPNWFARRGGAQGFVAALATGMDMNLRRLDELLASHEVEPLEVLQRPFDPHCMRAVEVTRDRKSVV